MITLINGDEDYLIREKLHDILQGIPVPQIHYVDLEKKKGSLQDFFMTCHGQSLFAEKMTVVVRNPYFFFGKVEEGDLQALEEYIRNPSKENDIIFYSQGGKSFDKRTKAYKTVKSNAHEILCMQLDERKFSALAHNLIRESGLSVGRQEEELLIGRSELSLQLLHQNILKLQLYDGKIDGCVLSSLLPETVSEDNFGLCDALFRKDSRKLFHLLEEYKKSNDTFLPLMALLASQLRYLYGVSYLSDRKYSEQSIAEEIGGKSKSVFRVQKAKESLTYIADSEILKLLESLSVLDEEIKKDSSVPEGLRFELCLLRWVNGYEGN